MARNLLKFYRGGFRLRHSLTILLALSLSLVPGAAFASSCEVGPATGVEPPLVTHLRAYPWTFRAPTRMALTADSSLLVSDPRRQHIVTREASGRIIDSHLHAGDPISVAVDAAGRVYVGDGDSGRVSVFSRNWEFLYDLGIGAGEFQLPVAIAVEPLDGRIYVVDSRSHEVKVFTPDGSPDFNFGGAGDGDGLFNFPAGIFVDAASAEVYVVDQLNYRVQVFDLQGGYLRCIGGTNANPGSFFGRKRPLNQPQGVWLDRAGRVLVSDAADGQVKVFDRNGNGLASIGEFGALPGGLRIPMDLAVDAHNRLFVAAANNSRLEVFGLDEYQDPEAVAPGVLDVDPAVLDRDALIQAAGSAGVTRLPSRRNRAGQLAGQRHSAAIARNGRRRPRPDPGFNRTIRRRGAGADAAAFRGRATQGNGAAEQRLSTRSASQGVDSIHRQRQRRRRRRRCDRSLPANGGWRADRRRWLQRGATLPLRGACRDRCLAQSRELHGLHAARGSPHRGA
jgi:sugar lactone lactonase YvrE